MLTHNSRGGVGGTAIEFEHSHQHPNTTHHRVTDGSRGEMVSECHRLPRKLCTLQPWRCSRLLDTALRTWPTCRCVVTVYCRRATKSPFQHTWFYPSNMRYDKVRYDNNGDESQSMKDWMTMKKQAAVKTARALTAQCGSDHTIPKTTQPGQNAQLTAASMPTNPLLPIPPRWIQF